ncbi:MAG: ABC transporter ATP-binding protein [Ruminococcaceae bacterium]|nr:ABC transporter ATP-binding protein [Oscillospiraceae bacterium]
MAFVKCEKCELAYEGKTVLSDLSFEVNKGDYLCIVGENGSGKSTLMKALLGLIKPVSGEIKFCCAKHSEIGYLPQQTDIQKDFPASVSEVVISGTLGRKGFKPFYTKKEKDLAKKNMEMLGISHLAKHSYQNLSGGQQQRVLLARALCATTSMLLLDEPVAGLDPVVTAEMYKIIKELNDKGIAIIMVSHDISAAVEYASHILHLRNKPLFFGTKEEYLFSDIASEFLGGDKK